MIGCDIVCYLLFYSTINILSGIKCRAEEVTMIAEKVMDHDGIDKHVGANKVIEFCAEEADRHAWTLVGSRYYL